MSERAQLQPDAALEYIRGGRGRATLVGKSNRFTYKFSTPKGYTRPIFVGLLTGPDNAADYRYLGYIPIVEDQDLRLVAGGKGLPDALSFQALQWYLKVAQRAPQLADKAQFYHEGVCARCGRALTVPSSIATGYGPHCAAKAGG